MNSIQEMLSISVEVQIKLIFSLVIILLLLIAKWITTKIIKHRIKELTPRYRWLKLSTYISFFLGLILIAPIWIKEFESLFTFLGIISAGLAIALRDIIANLFGWFYILWRRPFAMGDRIEINNVSGDVIDIRILEFTVMEVGNWVDADQSTGRVIHIPNGLVLNSNVANFTAGFEYIWNEISVLITFESEWEKAKAILQKLAEKNTIQITEHLRDKIIHSARKIYKNLTPIVYTTIKESGIELTIRYLCEPQQRRTSAARFWEDILREFADHPEIEFAYPTQRFYNKEMKKLLNYRDMQGKENN